MRSAVTILTLVLAAHRVLHVQSVHLASRLLEAAAGNRDAEYASLMYHEDIDRVLPDVCAAMLELRQHEPVISITSHYIDIHGVTPDAAYARAMAHSLASNHSAAVRDLLYVAQLSPSHFPAWLQMSRELQVSGAFDDAAVAAARALDVADTTDQSHAALVELGPALHRLGRFRAGITALGNATRIKPHDAQTWTLLAQGLMSAADSTAALHAFRMVEKLAPGDPDVLAQTVQALCLEGRTIEAEAAFRSALEAGASAEAVAHAGVQLAKMRNQEGRQLEATMLIEWLLSNATFSDDIAPHVWVAALHTQLQSHLALGDYSTAAAVGTRLLRHSLGGGDAPIADQTKGLVVASFYLKHVAALLSYTQDWLVSTYSVDQLLHTSLKEGWVNNKMPPAGANVSLSDYAAELSAARGNDTSPPDLESFVRLLRAADAVGALIRSDYDSFTPPTLRSARLRRAAGLAALELAQLLRDGMRAGGQLPSVEDESCSRQAHGARPSCYSPEIAHRTCAEGTAAGERRGSCQATAGEADGETARGGAACRKGQGRHAFGWRDAMDGVLRWRLIAEPSDPVLWLDGLLRKDPGSGFAHQRTLAWDGSSGAAFRTVLEVFKEQLLSSGGSKGSLNAEGVAEWMPFSLSPSEAARVRAASTPAEVLDACGGDTDVVLRVGRHGQPGSLRGATIALAKQGGASVATGPLLRHVLGDQGRDSASSTSLWEPVRYELTVNHEIAAERLVDYEAEMDAVWQRLLAALAAGSAEDLLQSGALLAFYWFNMLPVVQGCSFAGNVLLTAVQLAAGGTAVARPLPNYQPDLRALGYSESPGAFVSEWGDVVLGREQPLSEDAASTNVLPNADELPPVAHHMSTNRKRVLALNTLDSMSPWIMKQAPDLSAQHGPRFPAPAASWMQWHEERQKALLAHDVSDAAPDSQAHPGARADQPA